MVRFYTVRGGRERAVGGSSLLPVEGEGRGGWREAAILLGIIFKILVGFRRSFSHKRALPL